MIPHLLFGSQINVAVQLSNVAIVFFFVQGKPAYHTSDLSHNRSRSPKRYVVLSFVQEGNSYTKLVLKVTTTAIIGS